MEKKEVKFKMTGLIELSTLINKAINLKPLFDKDLNDIEEQLQIIIFGLGHIAKYDDEKKETKYPKCPHCDMTLEDIYVEHGLREHSFSMNQKTEKK